MIPHRRTAALFLSVAASLGAPLVAPLAAQKVPGAVLAKNEPHHHLAYEDGVLRVLRVRVPAHDSTLLHEHDPDYFWIALGASEVVNARPGMPDATIASSDLSIHYTRGNFAHVARNPAAVPFDNITVELPGAPQGEVRNLCEEAVAGAPRSCGAKDPMPRPGVTEHPAFETRRLRVALVTIAAGSSLAGTTAQPAPWLIALDAGVTPRRLRIATPSAATRASSATGMAWHGGVWRATPGRDWSVTNTATVPVRVLVVTPFSE
ncbi:MAG TPA: hypothetical protein VG916_00780 [Gemmatimonadaceae bacterium]|nr:hypothetical protein [Gemmatimonadaceae bacterium]